MPDPLPNLLAANQAKYNLSTRDHWDHFAQHRRQVTDLLAPGELAPRGRLCVLGAGNCNDLEIPRLLETFSRIDLVDIDGDALNAAVARQGVQAEPRVRLHGGVDLTAVAPQMAQWPTSSPGPLRFRQVLRTLETAPLPDIGGPFDVILSPCVLSQICLYASDSLGRTHPRRRELREAIRRRHLRQMVEWLAPGGTGLLVIDLATTQNLGSLVHTHHNRLEEVASRTVARANHFPGLDPESLRAAMLQDARLNGLVSSIQQIPPWLWTLGPAKSFLVYALRFRRSQTPVLFSK
jgi:hypothetical protein